MLVYCANNIQLRPGIYFVENASQQFLLSLSGCSSINRSLYVLLNVLKCCPRSPLHRQNKEATWSMPRTAPANINIGLFIRETDVFTSLYGEATVMFCNFPHICLGVILYVSFLYDSCWVNEPDCCEYPWPLRLWGPWVVTATCTPCQHRTINKLTQAARI